MAWGAARARMTGSSGVASVKYLARTVDSELDELLPVAPAIALDGPSLSGGTVLIDE